ARPLPQGGVPVASARGGFSLDGGVLRLTALEVGLLDGAGLEGEAAIELEHRVRVAGRELPASTARFKLAGIDPAHWVAAARPLRIDGEASLDGRELRATLRERAAGAPSLTGREALALELQASLGEEEILIDQVHVGHGASRLEASGTIRLEPLAIDLAGRARAIDPAQWLLLDDP